MNPTSVQGSFQNEIEHIPAIILCGGMGTRIAGITQDTIPKHLITTTKGTVLERAIEPFLAAKQVILATSQFSDQIDIFSKQKFKDRKVLISAEPEPLGVTFAITHALDSYNIKDRFLIGHGDEITPHLNLSDMLTQHENTKAELTVLATTRPPFIKDYSFTIDQANVATKLKRDSEILNDATSSNFGIGTFVCEQSILNTMLDSKSWTSFLYKMIEERRLHVYARDLIFHNINTPDDLAQIL